MNHFFVEFFTVNNKLLSSNDEKDAIMLLQSYARVVGTVLSL